MEILVVTPLREVVRESKGPGLRGVIIVDGLVNVRPSNVTTIPLPRPRGRSERANAEDQLEILEVLQAASLDPSFHFRILIASRPERVFREFFEPEKNISAFAKKLDLHEDHKADANTTLSLEAQYNR